MLANIGIRTLKQFIILSFLRLFWDFGMYINMTSKVILLFIFLSFLLTVLFESFDHFIIHYLAYEKIIYVLFFIVFVIVMIYGSGYQKSLIIYMIAILIYDLWQIQYMQKALKEYQKTINS